MRTERIEGAGQDARHAGGLAGSTLWLIARDAGGRSEPSREPLLVDDGGGRGGEALAVFGHEEEAKMFLGFWAPGDGWRAREIGAGELASLLRGPSWPGARRVALDPLPGVLAGAAEFNLLVGMDRVRFAGRDARDARGSLCRPSFRVGAAYDRTPRRPIGVGNRAGVLRGLRHIGG